MVRYVMLYYVTLCYVITSYKQTGLIIRLPGCILVAFWLSLGVNILLSHRKIPRVGKVAPLKWPPSTIVPPLQPPARRHEVGGSEWVACIYNKAKWAPKQSRILSVWSQMPKRLVKYERADGSRCLEHFDCWSQALKQTQWDERSSGNVSSGNRRCIATSYTRKTLKNVNMYTRCVIVCILYTLYK